jgi:hypothetical protein
LLTLPSKRRKKFKRLVEIVSPYPAPPRELAGKWVAWSPDYRIVASGETLAEVVESVKSAGIEDASYELVPRLDRYHCH